MDAIRAALGSIFFIGFEEKELAPATLKFIKDNNIGGFTLFKTNYQDPIQIAHLNYSLQEAVQTNNNTPPPFICVDHEGGLVQRFREGFLKIPTAQTIASLDSAPTTFKISQFIARELSAVGVNVNFAPVADINTNPNNPVIGSRAFGSDAEAVSKHVSAFVRGHLSENVRPVLKHFPGHGDTALDSHFHLPSVETSTTTLETRELLPFKTGLKSKADLMMSSHVIIKSIDDQLPCTLSAKALQKLLRDTLHFEGLVFSDDMEMKAMTDHFGAIDAPRMALEAGVDILLYHTMDKAVPAFEGLLRQVNESPKLQTLVLEKSRRVLQYRKQHFQTFSIDTNRIQTSCNNPEAQRFLEEHFMV